MTQSSRTTESISRDHETIRDIMQQIRNRLTVPDRATLAVGLVGHLATMMNGRQISRLMQQLQEEAERVQDVPPTRRRAEPAEPDEPDEADEKARAAPPRAPSRAETQPPSPPQTEPRPQAERP